MAKARERTVLDGKNGQAVRSMSQWCQGRKRVTGGWKVEENSRIHSLIRYTIYSWGKLGRLVVASRHEDTYNRPQKGRNTGLQTNTRWRLWPQAHVYASSHKMKLFQESLYHNRSHHIYSRDVQTSYVSHFMLTHSSTDVCCQPCFADSWQLFAGKIRASFWTVSFCYEGH